MRGQAGLCRSNVGAIISDPSDADIFRELYPALRRFAAVLTRPEDDPDDLVQEALTRTLRTHSLSSLDFPLAYLRRAIANLVQNTQRRRRGFQLAGARHGVTPESEAQPYPSDLADLLDLSPQQRAAMYLFDVEGYSFPEIADLLGCSADAARAAASRGRRLLAKNLTEPDGSVTT